MSFCLHGFSPLQAITLSKVRTNSTLTAMPKGRITHIMSQACSTHDCTQRATKVNTHVGILALQGCTDHITQATPHTANFKTMSQAIMNKDITGKRENLCLILQSSERRRKDQSIIISFKLTTCIITTPTLARLCSYSSIGEELLPVHHRSIHV